MFSEDDLLPISALQHLVFCERQWALIHLEQVWTENVLTTEGRLLHDHAHEDETETRGDIRTTRSLRIRSLRLGLAGMMDVVEFVREKDGLNDQVNKTAIPLADIDGLWRPVPVEYKRGKPKPNNCDKIQLCAQALCLEEMLDVMIPSGVIFYGRPRRRMIVELDNLLRKETESLTTRLHELTGLGKTPPPVYSKKCSACSLIDICNPEIIAAKSNVAGYIKKMISDMGFLSKEAGADK